MVIYDLKCALGHRFEGWFPNMEAFEGQLKEGLVECSVCGVDRVEQIPSGGHIAKSSLKVQKLSQKTALSPSSSDEIAANVDPVVLMKAVQKYVRDNFKDVGDQFADKARQIHRGEVPSEPIYGTAKEEQLETLEEEDVAFSRIPKLPEEFEN